jgi:hypothetical protein
MAAELFVIPIEANDQQQPFVLDLSSGDHLVIILYHGSTLSPGHSPASKWPFLSAPTQKHSYDSLNLVRHRRKHTNDCFSLSFSLFIRFNSLLMK